MRGVVKDPNAIGAVDIHPSGSFFVVGSDSKCMRICAYLNIDIDSWTGRTDQANCNVAIRTAEQAPLRFNILHGVESSLIAADSNDTTNKLFKYTPACDNYL